MDCSLVKTSYGQIVPSVVSLAACGVIVPKIMTLVVLIMHSCFVVYKA